MSPKKYCSCPTNNTHVVLVLRLVLRFVDKSRTNSWSSLKSLKTPTIYLKYVDIVIYIYYVYLYLHRIKVYLDLKKIS